MMFLSDNDAASKAIKALALIEKLVKSNFVCTFPVEPKNCSAQDVLRIAFYHVLGLENVTLTEGETKGTEYIEAAFKNMGLLNDWELLKGSIPAETMEQQTYMEMVDDLYSE